MILQRDPRMRWQIREYGCYLMSLIWWANKLHNLPVTAGLINEDLYTLFQRRGWMDEECYVKDPVAILNHLGVDVGEVRKEAPSYTATKDEIEVLFFKHDERGWSHFTAGDGEGHVTYDPWGVSTTATEGELVSKRIFTF